MTPRSWAMGYPTMFRCLDPLLGAARRSYVGRRAPVLAAALLLAGGCGGSEAGTTTAASAVRETLPDGTVALTYAAPVGVPVDTLSPDLRIGRADGAEWETFGQVTALDVGPGGTVHVLDWRLGRVHAFDAGGTYRGSMGRQGEGPGEFRQASGIALAPDGTLWIRDLGARSLVALSADGAEIARHPLPAQGTGATQWDAVFDERGVLWQSWRHRGALPMSTATTGLSGTTQRHHALSFTPERAAWDSVLVGEDQVRFIRWPQPPGFASAGVPFDPQALVAFDRTGSAWVAMSDSYRITRRPLGGGEDLEVRMDVQGPLAAGATRRGWQNLLAQAEVDIPIPERLRALVRIFTDDRNRLWVQRQVEADEAAHFDVLDRDGQLLGSVRFAEPMPPIPAPVVRGDHFYAVVVGELDVQQVVRAPLPSFAR